MKNKHLPLLLALSLSVLPFKYAVSADSERWVKQTKLVATETENGNCLAAAIASLFNIPLKDVPEFEKHMMNDDKEWYAMLRQFMYDHGYELMRIDGHVPLAGYYLVEGPSPRFAGAYHFVIMKNGKLFFDPHPSNMGLKSITYTYAFVSLDPAIK